MEIETRREDTTNRLLVPVAPGIGYGAADTVRVAMHPTDPGRIAPLDFANLWRNLLNPAAFLVVALVGLDEPGPRRLGSGPDLVRGALDSPTPPGAPSPDRKLMPSLSAPREPFSDTPSSCWRCSLCSPWEQPSRWSETAPEWPL